MIGNRWNPPKGLRSFAVLDVVGQDQTSSLTIGCMRQMFVEEMGDDKRIVQTLVIATANSLNTSLVIYLHVYMHWFLFVQCTHPYVNGGTAGQPWGGITRQYRPTVSGGFGCLTLQLDVFNP